MADAQSIQQRWQDFRPTKTALFWSCVVCIALTMIVGFTWGGWVTGGTAHEMMSKAAGDARAKLAAAICVDRFMDAKDAQSRLAALKESSSWKRDDLIEKAGWVTMPGMKEPVPDAANLCAERLMTAELSPANAAAPGKTTTVQ